ncbi:EAL domain-containing protein [Kordiimonas lacus]|uniref:EAL domain, c-di-GMP-specific phosphodiesterase class I (Or its enzymatically inactive variant) n=1 Tax=Kordiimonas lacus TaxID=637679 RepID=A0A1G7BEH5_9PROT|nr:EAL domain-containing protein [Kordiimonas lacus]SDE24776.1 EAL domain, c-di-GMP-specific phosphodiesterase class I (or its enzymatically inactive variant) [Kordiimonas lacus]
MSKVPGRFLGYAFCVGDVLLELDLEFNIQNADGAIKNTLGAAVGGGKTNFLNLLTDKGRGIIESAAKMLTGANRLGPFTVSIGKEDGKKEDFAVFIAKLPTANDRIYAVLSKPYRVGVSKSKQAPVKVEDKKQQFFERLEGLFEGNPDAAENMLVTVLEASSGQGIDPDKQKVIEEYLKSFSVGGSHATMLADDKFAVVHDKTNEKAQKVDFAAQLKKVTGVELTSATIDAAESNLSEEDNLKALVFSLQSFARDTSGGAVADIKKNCSTLIGETTERVKAFRKVLEDGAFSLVFQPIVHLKKNTVHHFEALTRFELPPMIKSQWEMIRFAEDVGLIDEFDYAVVTRAIRKIRELLKKGGAPGIAVNLSGRSLSSSEFMLELVSLLRGNKDLKQYLSLEITESAKIHDLDALGACVREMRDIGFKVYLDDFGAGAAGFQYLKKLRVDALKIDGDYIRDAIHNKEDRAYLRSMVMLCRDLGIVTVGEWVETEEHAKLLREMGVDYGQGYFFGKPSPNFLTEPMKAG